MAEKSTKHTRSRAPNFSKEDQLLLFDSIKPYAHIIECKQTDSVKQSDKQNAWTKITEVFNANTSNLHRTTENLLSCYRNAKSKFKKQHSEAKMLIKDPIHRDALVSAIEENGKNWEEVAVTVKQPIEVCQKGGGPPNPAYKDDPLNSIKKLIEPQIDGLFTIYDSDALLMSQYQLSLAEEERIKPIEENIIEFTSGHLH
ncbi:unnamed protein product [Colias eurytheme]|nr:unnamed protein product [Colias eurytheme]